MGCKGPLSRRGGGDGVLGAREGDEEGVALCVDLVAAGLLEGAPQQALVLGEDLAVLVAQLLEQPRRAFDVGEEERDGSARKLSHCRLLEVELQWV